MRRHTGSLSVIRLCAYIISVITELISMKCGINGPRKFPPFVEREGSLPCSHHPVTGPSPELDTSSPHLPTQIPEDPL